MTLRRWKRAHDVDVNVSEAAIGLRELADTSLGVADDLRCLAGDAGCCPFLDVCSDRVPDILLFQELDRCSFGWMREAVNHVENSFPEGGRNPRSRITRARVT